MIAAIYWLGIVAVVLINITALTLLAFRYIPFPATARAAAILLSCLGLFSLQHLIAFGTLHLAGFLLTAISLCVIWARRATLLEEPLKTSEIVFLCAVAVGAVWRLSYPEIVENNDRLTDFHLVSNYFSGERLPPLDHWLPHQKLDYYYTFQHYAAALLGRLFGLSPGASFNLAAIILAALVLALAWEFLTILRVRLGFKLLAVAALVIGGTGISPLYHLVTSEHPEGLFKNHPVAQAVFYNSRFIGWFETSVASDVWRDLFGNATQRSILLPIETFGYQYVQGGYHAVLSGFLLQFLALTIMVAIPHASKSVKARLEFILGITVPLSLCSSAWTFPLQTALITAWKIWEGRASGEWNLRHLVGGVAIGVLVLLPFLAGLGAATGHMQLQLVAATARTPLSQFLIVFWPLIALALVVPMTARASPLAGFFAAVFLGLLVFAELFNAYDQGYMGDFLRFNSTLKWWGWIFTGGVFSISALLLASNHRALRLAAALVLVLVSTFVIDSGRLFASRSFSGKFDGSGFYTRNRSNERMLLYLVDAPKGIVLEKLSRDTGIYGSFAQKPNLIGIPWVLRVWKRNIKELDDLGEAIEAFYDAAHPQAARFLADHNVRYVVWSIRERKDLEKWQSVMKSIEADYRWMEFSHRPDTHIGLWIRR